MTNREYFFRESHEGAVALIDSRVVKRVQPDNRCIALPVH